MKIGILTWYFGINYGARAHSLALYQTVRNLGYDCEFIQYTSSNTIKKSFIHVQLLNIDINIQFKQ